MNSAVDFALAEEVVVKSREAVERYCVDPQDVLITCRGTQMRSAVVPLDAPRCAIASSLIAVRLDPTVLLPGVFSAYIKTRPVLELLVRSTISRTNALNISTRDIALLSINVPSLTRQALLLELDALVTEYRELTRRNCEFFSEQSQLAIASQLLAASIGGQNER